MRAFQHFAWPELQAPWLRRRTAVEVFFDATILLWDLRDAGVTGVALEVAEGDWEAARVAWHAAEDELEAVADELRGTPHVQVWTCGTCVAWWSRPG